MRYDPSLSMAVWRALIAKALEDAEDRLKECENAHERFLTEEDIRLLRALVYGFVSMILVTVVGGVIAAGVLVASTGSVVP